MIFGAFSKIFIALFSRHLLKTKTSLALDRFVLILTGIALLYLLCALILPIFTAFQVATTVFFIFPAFFTAAGVWAWRKGKTQARFYIVGQIFSWVALFVFALTIAGTISYTGLTFEIVPLAICLDAIFLSLALAEHMRDLQMQKILAQEQAQKNLEIKKEELEHIVSKRTLQLTEARDEALRLAQTDALTKIYNRRYGIEAGERAFATSIKTQTPLVIAIMDIDNFKKVNDTWGHDEGDAVLCTFAQTIAAEIRTDDVFARWGGEEFILILPNILPNNAAPLLERLRRSVHTTVTSGPDKTPISASFGYASRIEADANFDHTVQRADQALYHAKRNGKNTVIFHDGTGIVTNTD